MAKKKKEKKGGKYMKKKELAEMLVNYFRMKPMERYETVVHRTETNYSSIENALCRYRSGNGRR